MRGDHDDYAVERTRVLGVFGENLRTLRKRRNLAQEGLAEVANSTATRSACLSGDRASRAFSRC
jgi:hypothetical protein